MKIQKSKSPSRKLVASIALVVLLLASGVAAYFIMNGRQGEASTTVGSPAESDNEQAKRLADNPSNKEEQVNTDVAPIVPTEGGEKATVNMVVSANVSGDKVYIRGGLNGAVVNDGQCYATLKSSKGTSVRKDTVLLQNASTTDCKTIIVDSSELSSGKWTAALNYSSDTMKGSSDEASFEIN